MARVCEICGKGPMTGHSVSHANNRTNRRWCRLPAVPSLTQQFDPSHFGAVARAMAQLDDPGVTAGTGGEARPQVLEEPVGHRPVLDAPLHLAAGVQIAAPRERDETLGVG